MSRQPTRRMYVAGVDYEAPSQNFKRATRFRVFAERRAEAVIVALPAGVELIVEVLDALSGEVVTSTVRSVGGRKVVSKTTEQRFEKVSEKSYDVKPGREPVFKPLAQPGVLSMVDVYAHVAFLGKSNPGTVQEVSIFSHGAMSGPILLNTYARPDLTEAGLRDPRDRDGRAALDFANPNTSDAQRRAMRDAFASKGYAWLWGCNFPRVFNKILNRIEYNPKYSNSIKDAEVLDFQGLGDDEIALLNDHLLGVMGDEIKGRRAKLRFGWMRDLIGAASAVCYAHRFAKGVGVTTYGALVGTYAEFERGRPPLMSIAGRFARRFEFFRRHLGINRDPEGRNYGRYEPELDWRSTSR